MRGTLPRRSSLAVNKSNLPFFLFAQIRKIRRYDMNGLGRSVNELLAFLAEAGKFECRHSAFIKSGCPAFPGGL